MNKLLLNQQTNVCRTLLLPRLPRICSRILGLHLAAALLPLLPALLRTFLPTSILTDSHPSSQLVGPPLRTDSLPILNSFILELLSDMILGMFLSLEHRNWQLCIFNASRKLGNL